MCKNSDWKKRVYFEMMLVWLCVFWSVGVIVCILMCWCDCVYFDVLVWLCVFWCVGVIVCIYNNKMPRADKYLDNTNCVYFDCDCVYFDVLMCDIVCILQLAWWWLCAFWCVDVIVCILMCWCDCVCVFWCVGVIVCVYFGVLVWLCVCNLNLMCCKLVIVCVYFGVLVWLCVCILVCPDCYCVCVFWCK